MEQGAPLDFPFPNEIIEMVISYLSPKELLDLATIATDRLKKCTFMALRKKSRELPKLLCQMSEKGDLDKIKQVFEYVNKENISMEEMGVKNNEINQGKKPTLVETNSGLYGRTPLISAAICGHHQVCEYLITEQRANLEARDDYQHTALILAAANNRPKVIKVLLQNNDIVMDKSENGFEGIKGYHAIHYAALYGHLDALKVFVENKWYSWEFKKRLSQGLCHLSSIGDLEKIKQIFAYFNQENINVEEMGVKSNAVNQGKKPTLVDTNGGFNGRTPLIEAAEYGHHRICKYLIKTQKANLEARDDDQQTALILAAMNNETEVIKVLLQNYANVKAKDKYGQHAAYVAAHYGNLDDLKLLVENDGDVIALKGPCGETPLIAASSQGMVDVCKYLVEEKNANVNVKDDNGDNALQFADDPEIITILRSKVAE